MGYKANAKNTPQTNGTNKKEPSLRMIAPKKIIIRMKAVRWIGSIGSN
jgi:hypothetical protein